MNKLFPTQEIGSLAKPAWRVKPFKGQPLSEAEIAEAVEWGERLGIDSFDNLIKILTCWRATEGEKIKLLQWSAKYAIRFFETAGLDVVFDGEQWRSEMYEHVIRNVEGFEFLGYVKSFDFRYFNKASCVSKPKYVKPFYLEEFIFTKENTDRIVKVPFTGPYTIVDWTFNEYYERKAGRQVKDFNKRKASARTEFIFDFIKEVVRPEVDRLIKAGAEWIQIDEPAATTNPSADEMQLFVDAFNETVKGFNCIFSLHNCFSNYEVLAKYACELRNCSQLALEFANRDGRQLGVGSERAGYKELKLFEDYGFGGSYGLGVIDVHTDFVEPPELVRDRILHAVKVLGNPDRIYVSTDCGLRTRTWHVSFSKLKSMVLGADLARKALKQGLL